jgi:hypothetical protein
MYNFLLHFHSLLLHQGSLPELAQLPNFGMNKALNAMHGDFLSSPLADISVFMSETLLSLLLLLLFI